jgi:hypothetical protein
MEFPLPCREGRGRTRYNGKLLRSVQSRSTTASPLENVIAVEPPADKNRFCAESGSLFATISLSDIVQSYASGVTMVPSRSIVSEQPTQLASR